MSEVDEAQRPAAMADKDIIDDDRLRRGRLRGALARGSDWRRRPEKSTTKRLLIGAALALTAVLILLAIGFVQVQLAKQAAAKNASLSPTPSPTAAAGTHSQTPGAGPTK